jgi:hypothetical protein
MARLAMLASLTDAVLVNMVLLLLTADGVSRNMDVLARGQVLTRVDVDGKMNMPWLGRVGDGNLGRSASRRRHLTRTIDIQLQVFDDFGRFKMVGSIVAFNQ